MPQLIAQFRITIVCLLKSHAAGSFSLGWRPGNVPGLLQGPLRDMVKKGQGSHKSLAGQVGSIKALAAQIHSRARTWEQLPLSVIVCILGSLPGSHRRSRIGLAHKTLPELQKMLRDTLRIKVGQTLPSRDTKVVILDAILHSYILQHRAIPPAPTSVKLLFVCVLLNQCVT